MMVEVDVAAVPVERGTVDGGDNAESALSQVFTEHYSALVGLACLLVDDRGLAEEIVQEAFARTYAAWSRLRDRDAALPYVRRAVVNLARGGLRRRAVARRARLTPVVDMPSAEATALVGVRRREVADAVRALPTRQRECVVLRFGVDCSIREIAVELGISEGAVKQHLHRALAALADALGPTDQT